MATSDLDDGYDPFEEFNRSAGMGVVENPYPMFALVRPQHPMKREDEGEPVLVPEGSDIDFMPIDRSVGVFTAYSFEAVQQVLKDGETFSSQGYADIMGQVLGHSILEMDEPEHHLYRGLVQQAFSRKAMETWERELVRDVVDEHIDAFVDRPTKRADLVREVTFPFPVVVIARLLGLPREDLPMFHRRAVEVISAGFELDRAAKASQALFDYFCTIIAERRTSPVRRRHLRARASRARRHAPQRRGDLLVPAAPAARRRGDHLPLVVEPLVRIACRSPTSSTRCAPIARSLPQAIEEGLRWEAPLIGIMRTAARDSEVEGMFVPAGSIVAVNIGSANHDEKVWEQPGGVRHLPARRASTSRSRGARTCASACTSRAWRRAS